MSEKLLAKHPIYPAIGLLASVLILVVGVAAAKRPSCIFFLGGTWLVFLAFGYWRTCFAILPVAAIFCALFAGVTYAISGDTAAAMAAVSRLLAVCVAVIPGLALPPIMLVRNFSALKIPRILTLGMMITLTFFPLLGAEVRQVREAMRTRGAGSFFSPQIFYRAFLIPLVMRLVNISDTLALSVETRGFTGDAKACTVYKTVSLRPADCLLLLLVLAGAGLAVLL